MTVTYTGEIASCKWFGCFLKLLGRWKGSIYKLLWLDVIVYLGLYFAINFVYRFTLHEQDKKTFENMVRYCAKYANLIPLSFVLGFYVSLVMERWWKQYQSIPYPDTIALLVGSLVKGTGDQVRLVKRTILRYVCLSFTMTLSMISPKVKKRFPDLDSLVEAGLLLQNEKDIFDELDDEDYPSYTQYWLPLAWASNITTKARTDGQIKDDVSVKIILKQLNKFRSDCGTLLDYDWISVPLVYTQVVTLAVYSYFLTTLISRQTLEVSEENVVDLYFPVFTILEYFFYVGWLKVAESLINPFGEDDDDFEVVWLVDRNIQMSYIIVDKIHNNLPPLKKDKHWDVTVPVYLSYTATSKKYMQEGPVSSTRNIKIKDRVMLEPDPKELRQLRYRSNKHRQLQHTNSLNLPDKDKRRKLLHRKSEPVFQKIPSEDIAIEMDRIPKPEMHIEEKTTEMEKNKITFDELKEQRLLELKEKQKRFLKYMKLMQEEMSAPEQENDIKKQKTKK